MANGAVTGALVRELNLHAVYQAVWQAYPVTRADLARQLRTSKPTIGRAVEALLAAGLIEEVAAPADAAGYSAVYFGPRAGAAAVLALDLGTRYLRGMVADLDGAELARIDVLVDGHRPAQVLAAAAGLRDQLVAAAGVKPELVTMGIAGVIEPRSGVVYSANQQDLDGFAAAAELRVALGCPVLVENDINLAAVGEGWRGAGAGVRDFAFLHIGSGVGAGLVLGGELHRGRNGAAGEIDFVPEGQRFQPDSPAADAFLAQIWQRSDFVNCEDVMTAARAGDRRALDLVAWEADRIAEHAARLTTVVDVGLIVLGGGIGLNGDLLAEPVRAALSGLTAYPPEVEISRLGEAVILTGAVATGLRSVRTDLVTRRVAALE
ncbi:MULTISPECIES: ROK family transcriptional regulator [unclassified Crossiella]|uniref:ROK family transcriptional regulator n=1 Tax=unclassified Crossiella TaxID=2620835 RepID=UPI0020003999|nr:MULTISPECIES: ROK family transcriptional regulator [unclassified Crossiella]MCK2242955.1 ROK family transcriptional regulator [Crossiella sp. S99.2]MCK2256832.1 ROK family transcriptional regulator [Crossiella sp. S99.1]